MAFAMDRKKHRLLPISELALAEGICYPRGPLGCHPVVVDGEVRAGCRGERAVLLNTRGWTIGSAMLVDICSKELLKDLFFATPVFRSACVHRPPSLPTVILTRGGKDSPMIWRPHDTYNPLTG